ncbi:SusC/RagA family TonB-linked outer membrane protein [Mucilaginibacter paludis]|uniref:TonB-dependent receptor plug n=1 Tax=Mucilaginibacter paludis DSM 18603 TaxID=714943 RepID=H1XZ26_9SPHI|nr:SusC/RagA family TonB-linked outer membrane protein [Mucilaginibacter paludis]EHQ24611.1 TonB-dependent receptor plug [Mucilaginibacter paludis DSM 18603]
MRINLTSIIIFLALLQASARGYSQISLHEKNVSIQKVFQSIEKQTKFTFLYDTKDILATEKVSVDLNNASVEQVMDKVLENSSLTYKIVDKMVLVKKKEQPTFLPKVIDKNQPKEIRGQVADTLSNPISGASVRVKSKNISTITDAAGRFNLKGVDNGDVITVDFIGYQQGTQVVKEIESNFYYIILKSAINKLDQVVIQAYGITTQRLNTGDIGKVTAAEIKNNPVMNPLLALQGRIPGLNVTQNNGFASAPVSVQLRGRTAISSVPSDPLYIIDGVPLGVNEISGNVVPSNSGNGSVGLLQNGNRGPAGGQSPFFNINPNDIESIEVLKDADATAIYGSRGANGVIIITTKKGKAGQTQFNINYQEGVTRVTKFYDVLNTTQYLEMRKEAFKNDNLDYTDPNNAGGAYDLLQWNQNSFTDWQKAIYGGTGRNTNIQTSLNGGNQQTTFRIGAGYNRTTNVLSIKGSDQLANISLSLIHKALDNRFILSLDTKYSLSQSDMIDLPGGAITSAPNAPSIYDQYGNLNFDGWGGQNTDARNAYPFGSLKQPYNAKTSFLSSNLNLSYQIAKDLIISTNLGYNISHANQEQYYLIASQDPINDPTGRAFLGYNNNQNLIIEPQLSYKKLINKGTLQLLIGGTSQKTLTDGLSILNQGYTSDETIMALSNATSQSNSNVEGEYLYAGLFARANFNWDNKYLINLSGRRDGSSRFGPGKQYGNFGAIGAAWIFTEETWFKNNAPFLSFGKLRASYGLTGSDGIGDYKYLTRWTSDGNPLYGDNVGINPIQHANPNYQWQVNKKLEAGINLGFLKDRIIIEATRYQDRTGNQLVDFPLPAYTGFTSVTANSPALIENSGWEFATNAKILETKQFNWSFNFNLSINRNRLISYPNLQLSPYANKYIIGKSLNIVRRLHFTGVDPQTGQYTFEDKNHDGAITYDYSGKTSDDSYILDLSPKYSGGVGTNFNYNGIQLGLFFSYRKQVGVSSAYGVNPGLLNLNQPVSVLNRWQKPGDITTVARFTTTPSQSDNNFSQLSDGTNSDASFIRLSNLSLGYTVPSTFTKKLGITGCSIFINANNLFVITKYKGIDPETQNFGGLPPVRTIVTGANFNF